METPTTTYSADEAAKILNVDGSYIRQLCRAGRLGQQIPRNGGRAWTITAEELETFRNEPRKRAGRKPTR